MRRPKVLIATSELHGGSASYVVQLASILAGGGAAIWASYFPNRRHLEPEMLGVAVRVIPLRAKYSSPLGLPRNAWHVLSTLRREAPDVVYTNTVFPMIVVTFWRSLGLLPRSLRVVHTLHSLFHDKFRATASRRVAALVERVMGRYVDRVVAPSEYMARLGRRLYGPEKIVLIKNSLSERLERDLLDMRSRRRNRVPTAPYKLLFVGRADRQKGLDTLLEAFALLRPRLELRLQVAGVSQEEYRAAYGRLNIDVTGVEFLGWLTNTASLYSEADLFVMPSRWEAFGLTLLEARLAGLFCIGSDVDAIPELIGPGHGCIVPPDDVQALALAIARTVERLPDAANCPGSGDLPTYAQHRDAQQELLRSLTAT